MTVRLRFAAGAALGLTAACSPSNLLSVPAPSGEVPSSGFTGQSGAESLLATGASDFFQGLDYFNSDNVIYQSGEGDGLLFYAGALTDEITWANSQFGTGTGAAIDARFTAGSPLSFEWGDIPLTAMLRGRVTLLLAVPLLKKYEPAASRSEVGVAYSLLGYNDLFLAEDYCAGLPLSSVLPGGNVQYGTPLSTDSLLGVAESEFDSALAYAKGVDSTIGLASVGLGRVRLDRGNFTGAAAAVGNVPTGYAYNVVMQANTTVPPFATNPYAAVLIDGSPWWNVADREGANGLNFVSANDPRLVLDSTLSAAGQPLTTYDGSAFYYPVKFGLPTASTIPLATGVEARLIEAEAALEAGNVGQWATDLNSLRAAAPTTYLALSAGMAPLTPDSTMTASHDLQVDVMFRERAFWLFGLGTRLGDLRRLVRQYGRDQSTVYPTGAYPLAAALGIPNYGPDLALTLPTLAGGTTNSNPNYHGCLNHQA